MLLRPSLSNVDNDVTIVGEQVNISRCPTPEQRRLPAPREGVRVFRIKPKAERPRLRELHRELVAAMLWGKPTDLPDEFFRFKEDYRKRYEALLELRRKEGKRTPPRRLPPVPLPFQLMIGGKVYGDERAAVIVDLDAGELRIPARSVKVQLQKSLVAALVKELKLDPLPSFTFFLTRKGEPRLVAKRSPPEWWAARESGLSISPPYRVIGVSVNDAGEVVIVAFDISEKVRMVKMRRTSPPGCLLHLLLIDLLQNWGRNADEIRRRYGKLGEKAVRKYEELRKRIVLTTERVRNLCERIQGGIRKRRLFWVRHVLKEVRELIREAGGRAILAVSSFDFKSIREEVRGSAARVVKGLKNLAAYEGALCVSSRYRGTECPVCGNRGQRVIRHYYRCDRCSIVWGEDYGAAFSAAAVYAPELKKWLLDHPRVFARNLELDGSRT